MAEMATKVPLFPGDSEIDQLFQIYRILGTPNESSWPGITELPEYKPVGPKWKKKDLMKELNDKLDKDGIDLLQKSLIYAPNKRITAKQMLNHPWFDQIRAEMIEQFGNIYPHCGNKQYQLMIFNKQKEMKLKQKQREQRQQRAKENIQPNNDNNVGSRYNLRKRRRTNDNNNNDKNKNRNNKNKKNDRDEIDDNEMNQDTDYEGKEDDIDDTEDDDDDITGNAEEWNGGNADNNYRSKLRSYASHNKNNNLSQPMDEDGDEE